jgi:hypothetical protein
MVAAANRLANSSHGSGRTTLDIPRHRCVRSGVLWSTMDALNSTTDQKVGGSNPSERASKAPGHQVDDLGFRLPGALTLLRTLHQR